MSKIEYTTIIETTTTINSNNPNSTITKTTKKVIYKEPEIIIEKNAFNNRKNKKAKSVQKNLTGDDYLGVPRMVQILQQNEQMKHKMNSTPWKYPQKIKVDPKKPSKLKNLYYSQFHIKK